jgi:hypothetical protein
MIILGDALMQTGKLDEAVTSLEESVSILKKALGDDHPTALQVRGTIAVARLAGTRRSRVPRRSADEPIAALEHAAPRLPEIDPDGARRRFALARELVATGRDRARDVDLAGRARRAFDELHRPRHRDEIDRWLAGCGARARGRASASAPR